MGKEVYTLKALQQTFTLLHKQIKIIMILSITPVIFILGVSMFPVEDFNWTYPLVMMIFLLLSLIITTVIAIGWSNEVVLHGKITGKMTHYVRRFSIPYTLVLLAMITLFMLANAWMGKTILHGFDSSIEAGSITLVHLAKAIQWVIHHPFIFLFHVIMNVLLLVLLCFFPYALIVDNKGLYHAFTSSIIYGFKGMIAIFLGVLFIFVYFQFVSNILFTFYLQFPMIIGKAIVLSLSYFHAFVILYMVSLYHGLTK